MTPELCWNSIICLKGEVMFQNNIEKHLEVTAEKNLYKNNAFIIIWLWSISEKFPF